MSEIFITSDTHFFHKRIMEYCPTTRFGADYIEMTANLIEAWNFRVSNDDVVYHLGDFSFGNETLTNTVLYELKGKIHLIKGNHDGHQVLTHPRFSSVQDYLELKHNREHFVMFHFPISRWNKAHYGSMHLYGHCHGSFKNGGRSMDVGVDTRNDMAPYHIDEIVNILKPIETFVEHH